MLIPKATRRKAAVIGVTILAVVFSATLATVAGASSHKKTHTSIITHTTQQEAVLASISVARNAQNITKGSGPVTQNSISAAAIPDKGTLIVLRNIGTIPGSSGTVAFQWDFGSAPILTCVKVPADRKKSPSEVPCPRGIKTITPPGPKAHHTTTTSVHKGRSTTTTQAPSKKSNG
jgi:hypothetical protein